MNEKQFMVDLWDVLAGNDTYCPIMQFRERYDHLRMDSLSDRNAIRFMDDHNEWHLTLQKVWCDENSVVESLAEIYNAMTDAEKDKFLSLTGNQ